MVRHVLGISGGKDSAALAIYMKGKYPSLNIEYYNSDTGCAGFNVISVRLHPGCQGTRGKRPEHGGTLAETGR